MGATIALASTYAVVGAKERENMGDRQRYSTITFSQHARDQMRTRLISATQVERAIADPTRRYPSTNPPGRIVVERITAAGNTLRVVYVEVPRGADTIALVVTVIRIGGRLS